MSVTTLSDFQIFGLPPHTIWDGSWESVARLVEAAESMILAAIRAAGDDVPIPETSWTPEMIQNACIIAGYHYLRVRGWTATDGADAEFVTAYKAVIEWLARIREGREKPIPKGPTGETLDATPTSTSEGVVVYSEPLRGW